jgi:lysophospholipase L1-like esterase
VIDAEQHYHERMEVFARERVEPGGIVFLGSSHLEWFDTDRLLPGRRIVNRGIASDRLGIDARGILHRLDISVFACRPSFITFQNGINDLGELARNGEPSLDEIFECYERVVAAIRERLPNVPLCLVNEMPTRDHFACCLPFVPPLNEHIRRMAEKYGCIHLDIYRDVVNEGSELRADLTYDGLHLNEKGYRLWARRLEEILPPAS